MGAAGKRIEAFDLGLGCSVGMDLSCTGKMVDAGEVAVDSYSEVHLIENLATGLLAHGYYLKTAYPWFVVDSSFVLEYCPRGAYPGSAAEFVFGMGDVAGWCFEVYRELMILGASWCSEGTPHSEVVDVHDMHFHSPYSF